MLKTLTPTLCTFVLAALSYGQAGTLDPSFGTGGFVETIVSTAGSRSSAVAVQPDGRILLAGRKTVTGGADGAIVRYLSTGTVDLSFALNGYLFTPNGGTLNWVAYLCFKMAGSSRPEWRMPTTTRCWRNGTAMEHRTSPSG